MGVCLHDHPILLPAILLAEAKGGYAHRWTLGLVLEVVAAKGDWVPLGRVQHVEAPEQAH
jgi:hypothetical protein